MGRIAQYKTILSGVALAMFLSLFSTDSISAIEPSALAPGAVLVQWDSGQITLGECVKYLRVVKYRDSKDVSAADLRVALGEMAMNEYLYGRAVEEKFRFDKAGIEVETSRVKRELLTILYVEEEIGRKVTVSDEEVAASLGKIRPKYVVRVFTSGSREKAEDVLSRLGKGERFEDLVRTRSEGLGAEGGGLLGDIDETRKRPFSDDQFETVARLRTGEHSGILEMPTGYAIVYMERSLTVEEQRAEGIRRNRDAVEVAKERKVYQQTIDRLRKSAKVRFDKKALREAFDLMKQGKPLPARLAAKPLVRVNGRPIYAGEVERRMGPVHSETDMTGFIDKRIDDELIVEEAERAGYGPRVAVELDLVRKDMVARAYLKEKTRKVSKVTEADLRKYYRENPERFRSPDKRAMQIIQVSERAKAERALSEYRAGADFDLLATEYNESADARRAKGYAGFLSYEQVAADVRDPLFRLGKGEVSGVLESAAGGGKPVYVVVRVLDTRPEGPIPFEKINRRVIEDRIVSSRREEAIRDLLKGRPPLAWQEENLKKIAAGG